MFIEKEWEGPYCGAGLLFLLTIAEEDDDEEEEGREREAEEARRTIWMLIEAARREADRADLVLILALLLLPGFCIACGVLDLLLLVVSLVDVMQVPGLMREAGVLSSVCWR